MIRESVSSLGYSLTKEHPATVEEYNALCPKREDACRQDAVASTDYRSVFPVFRDTFLIELGKEYGVDRNNSGTEDEPKWETEGKWHARIVAKSGMSREDFIAKHTTQAQVHMDAAPFDPTEREKSSDGPKVGKRDKEMAEELLGKGTEGQPDYKPGRGAEKVAQVVAALSAKLNRPVASDIDSVARAIADHRRLKAKEQEEANKKEIGL